jgi:ferritin-like metal-binding protein YciE
LLTVPELHGDQEIVRVCCENLQEEEAMAAWLAEHLPDLVRKYLSRSTADVEAKR